MGREKGSKKAIGSYWYKSPILLELNKIAAMTDIAVTTTEAAEHFLTGPVREHRSCNPSRV